MVFFRREVAAAFRIVLPKYTDPSLAYNFLPAKIPRLPNRRIDISISHELLGTVKTYPYPRLDSCPKHAADPFNTY